MRSVRLRCEFLSPNVISKSNTRRICTYRFCFCIGILYLSLQGNPCRTHSRGSQIGVFVRTNYSRLFVDWSFNEKKNHLALKLYWQWVQYYKCGKKWIFLHTIACVDACVACYEYDEIFFKDGFLNVSREKPNLVCVLNTNVVLNSYRRYKWYNSNWAVCGRHYKSDRCIKESAEWAVWVAC